MKVILVLLPLLAIQVTAGPFEEPDEYAPYKVIRTAENYEERVYPPTKWVCHDVEAEFNDQKHTMISFNALFMYISGENELVEEIPMTAPVSMMKQTLQNGKNLYQMCFYLPKAHQARPPAPTNPEVYIEERPELRIFTRIFGGYIWTEQQWEILSAKMKNILKLAGEKVKADVEYRIGYDAPMKTEGRRNEVWFIAE